jgi:hypothetical protein
MMSDSFMTCIYNQELPLLSLLCLAIRLKLVTGTLLQTLAVLNQFPDQRDIDLMYQRSQSYLRIKKYLQSKVVSSRIRCLIVTC